MLIRPAVTRGSETCTLTKYDENLLRIFERKNTAEDLRAKPRGGYLENYK